MQSKWKKIIAVLMIAVFVLSGCGSIGEKKNSANGTVHLTFGHGQAEGHPYHKRHFILRSRWKIRQMEELLLIFSQTVISVMNER